MPQPHNLELPVKGFTKAERLWLKELIEAIRTVQGIQGRHVTIFNDPGQGQIINADDCKPCP